ncbi:hypothetical protein ANCDUO_21999, partial [Ancylostoma duodenale]
MTHMDKSEEIQQFLARAEIEWKFITPYAPWQGGFYERLIQSVKRSMYKAIGKKVLDFEELSTLLSEIEASLNCRPLTYMESEFEEMPCIRPIDFIQRNIILSYPLQAKYQEEAQDESYLPPEERSRLETRNQAIAALEQLREYHKRSLKQGKSTPMKPRLGQYVLVMDANLPRNVWRMGQVTKINSPREVELRLPTRKLLRRPTNLLVPLELGEENQEIRKPQEVERRKLEEKQATRYNLRPRKVIDYAEACEPEAETFVVNALVANSQKCMTSNIPTTNDCQKYAKNLTNIDFRLTDMFDAKAYLDNLFKKSRRTLSERD